MKPPKTTAATQGSRNAARDRCLLLLIFRRGALNGNEVKRLTLEVVQKLLPDLRLALVVASSLVVVQTLDDLSRSLCRLPIDNILHSLMIVCSLVLDEHHSSSQKGRRR
jgi:hypothetical protein